MTWRKEPYPFTEDEIKAWKEYWDKYDKAIVLMEDLKIPFEKVTCYPFGFPDGMVSIVKLYEVLMDPNRLAELIEKVKK